MIHRFDWFEFEESGLPDISAELFYLFTAPDDHPARVGMRHPSEKVIQRAREFNDWLEDHSIQAVVGWEDESDFTIVYCEIMNDTQAVEAVLRFGEFPEA